MKSISKYAIRKLLLVANFTAADGRAAIYKTNYGFLISEFNEAGEKWLITARYPTGQAQSMAAEYATVLELSGIAVDRQYINHGYVVVVKLQEINA